MNTVETLIDDRALRCGLPAWRARWEGSPVFADMIGKLAGQRPRWGRRGGHFMKD
jgi:hypothetical protein